MSANSSATSSSHPQGCKDPDCQLTYREHLLSVGIGAECFPTRSGHHKGESINMGETAVRQKRWDRDMAAYLRLRKQGYGPPKIDGSYALERYGRGASDFNGETMRMNVDYSDGSTNLPTVPLDKLPDKPDSQD